MFYMNSNLAYKITILTHALVEVVENIREAHDDSLLHDLLSLKQLLMVSIILFYSSKWTTIVSEEQQTVGLKHLQGNPIYSIKNIDSDSPPISHGIPRVAVSGLLQLFIFINDLYNSIKNLLMVKIFPTYPQKKLSK